MKCKKVEFNTLLGLTFSNVEKTEEESIKFYTADGKVYELCHLQDCCEDVNIESVVGDLKDLVGTPILQAEESSKEGSEEDKGWDGSATWTFFKLATIKGYVDIRFFGTSNGYYSESANLYELT